MSLLISDNVTFAHWVKLRHMSTLVQPLRCILVAVFRANVTRNEEILIFREELHYNDISTLKQLQNTALLIVVSSFDTVMINACRYHVEYILKSRSAGLSPY
jgi:hypothetical protein